MKHCVYPTVNAGGKQTWGILELELLIQGRTIKSNEIKKHPFIPSTNLYTGSPRSSTTLDRQSKPGIKILNWYSRAGEEQTATHTNNKLGTI